MTLSSFTSMLMSRGMRFLVASFVKKSLSIEMVEMLSEMKVALPLLHAKKGNV